MKKKKLNVVWVEDVKASKSAIWYSLQPDVEDLGFQFNITYYDSGKDIATSISATNGLRGKDGYNEENIVHLMLVDYNLEETQEENQISGIDGRAVIIETRACDHEIPILFYTGNTLVDLQKLVDGEHNVYCAHRDDINAVAIRILKEHFI